MRCHILCCLTHLEVISEVDLLFHIHLSSQTQMASVYSKNKQTKKGPCCSNTLILPRMQMPGYAFIWLLWWQQDFQFFLMKSILRAWCYHQHACSQKCCDLAVDLYLTVLFPEPFGINFSFMRRRNLFFSIFWKRKRPFRRGLFLTPFQKSSDQWRADDMVEVCTSSPISHISYFLFLSVMAQVFKALGSGHCVLTTTPKWRKNFTVM